jgi:hypothetical protein
MKRQKPAYQRPGDTVHHLDLNCPIGREIPYEWRENGSGSLPLCSWCKERQSSGAMGSRDQGNPQRAT